MTIVTSTLVRVVVGAQFVVGLMSSTLLIYDNTLCWHMQVGTVFFDAPYGKTTATAGETHQETCKVIYSPEGYPPGTYSKRIAIGPVAKKLSQIEE